MVKQEQEKNCSYKQFMKLLKEKQAIYCTKLCTLPESLLESLLFGTTKGSYTGAIERAGLFELVDGGTLFLDELNSMPLDLQAKMLRVLEDGVIRRIGDNKTRKVDVRVITAMNQPPEICLRENKIRTDLYYRLNVFSLYIPPLRERTEDVLLLASYFLKEYNKSYKKVYFKLMRKRKIDCKLISGLEMSGS